jgi:leucyl-tRNA synthetase
LFDKGLVPTNEPFKKLINQGMIQGVIETIHMQKEKVEGVNRFVCADIAAQDENNEYVNIPVHIDYVCDYGSDKSYLNLDSIKKFVDWRPSYADAIFVCGNGTYQNGVFTPTGDAADSHLVTKSEIGKMSKRLFNVVNPDDVVEQYGADTFRMYEMFLGPVEQSKPWNTQGINGVAGFLRKYYELFHNGEDFAVSDAEPTKEEYKILHTVIKKVRTDIERFSLNTCVSGFMEAVNALRKVKCNKSAILQPLTVLLAPFAPHVAEEMWSQLGNEGSVTTVDFPEFNEDYLKEDSVEYPLCINGKKRATATFAADTSKADLEKEAVAHPNIQKHLEGKTVRKVIVVPGRMINIVVG